MSIEPCLCGADDCKRCFPFNRQACKVSDNDRADALELIVEEVLDTGKFPQLGRTEVDLYEFVTEELDSSFAYELVVAALGTNKPALEARIERLYDQVQAMLKKHLEDSDCVDEMAQDICDDRSER
jgi:hypothetical protein